MKFPWNKGFWWKPFLFRKSRGCIHLKTQVLLSQKNFQTSKMRSLNVLEELYATCKHLTCTDFLLSFDLFSKKYRYIKIHLLLNPIYFILFCCILKDFFVSFFNCFLTSRNMRIITYCVTCFCVKEDRHCECHTMRKL